MIFCEIKIKLVFFSKNGHREHAFYFKIFLWAKIVVLPQKLYKEMDFCEIINLTWSSSRPSFHYFGNLVIIVTKFYIITFFELEVPSFAQKQIRKNAGFSRNVFL